MAVERKIDEPLMPAGSAPLPKVITYALTLAIIAALGALFSGLGFRTGLWGFRTGLLILRYSVYLAMFSTLLSLFGFVAAALIPGRPTGAFKTAFAAFIISVIVVVIPLSYYMRAQKVPPIHDISTDTIMPPQFTHLQPARPDPAPYGGPGVAGLQKKGYPDIAPLELDLTYDQTFDVALKAAKRMRWIIVEENRTEGKIEAVGSSFWFGFKDDIAVRLTKIGINRTRVDVRSVSRVGRSDIGVNAARIRKYFKKIDKDLQKMNRVKKERLPL